MYICMYVRIVEIFYKVEFYKNWPCIYFCEGKISGLSRAVSAYINFSITMCNYFEHLLARVHPK